MLLLKHRAREGISCHQYVRCVAIEGWDPLGTLELCALNFAAQGGHYLGTALSFLIANDGQTVPVSSQGGAGGVGWFGEGSVLPLSSVGCWVLVLIISQTC